MKLLKCNTCGELKDIHRFSKHQTSKRGYQYNCKKCMEKKRRRNNKKLLKKVPDRLSIYFGFWKRLNNKWLLWSCGESDPLTTHLFKRDGYLVTQVSEKFYCQINQLINSSFHGSGIAKKMNSRLYPVETGQHLRKQYEGYEN